MRSVGLKVLKNKLSEYVRMASQGETVLVTDRDRVVAELSPPRRYDDWLIADVKMAELVREGVIRTPLRTPADVARPLGKKTSIDMLLNELESDRRDR